MLFGRRGSKGSQNSSGDPFGRGAVGLSMPGDDPASDGRDWDEGHLAHEGRPAASGIVGTVEGMDIELGLEGIPGDDGGGAWF